MKAQGLYDFGYVSDDNLPVYDSNHKYHAEIEKDDVVDVNMNIKADAKDVLNAPYGMCYLCKHNGKYRYIPIQYLDIDFSKKDIDWEQRMYEITMHAMPSCIESKYRTSHSTSEIVNDTLEIAKEFIKKLKEMEGKNE